MTENCYFYAPNHLKPLMLGLIENAVQDRGIEGSCLAMVNYAKSSLTESMQPWFDAQFGAAQVCPVYHSALYTASSSGCCHSSSACVNQLLSLSTSCCDHNKEQLFSLSVSCCGHNKEQLFSLSVSCCIHKELQLFSLSVSCFIHKELQLFSLSVSCCIHDEQLFSLSRSCGGQNEQQL